MDDKNTDETTGGTTEPASPSNSPTPADPTSPHSTSAHSAPTRPSRTRPAPSPPWFGGLILACLTAATIWVLTYTLAPLPGQRTLGGWNYAIAGLLLTMFIRLSMAWHGDPPER